MQTDHGDEDEIHQRVTADDADGKWLDNSKQSGHFEDQKGQRGEQRDGTAAE
ncbi:MAG: hypothetical protein WCS43_04205 [Verrucomicrobiota bacterium]